MGEEERGRVQVRAFRKYEFIKYKERKEEQSLN